jgi:hypothetical protein
MSGIDPVEQLKAQRPEAPPVDPVVSASARERMLAGSGGRGPRVRARRGAVIGGIAVALGCALVLAVALRPGNGANDAMAAAVERLANVAEHQRQIEANGRKQWLVSYFQTRSTWTQNLTQARLDELTANQVAMIKLRDAGYMGRVIYSKKLSRAEVRRQKRSIAKLQARTDAPVKAGVKISELPATTIVSSSMLHQAYYFDVLGRGGGAGGGLPNQPEDNRPKYGSPAQARAASILQKAGIGGNRANPSFMMGMMSAVEPASNQPKPAIVKSLSSDPESLRKQLVRLNLTGTQGVSDGAKPIALFKRAATVVSSPYTPPPVRAAAIRLIADLPGVTASPATDERGRPGLGLTKAVPGGTRQLVFDQNDARLLGMNIRITDPVKFEGRSYAGGGKHRVKVLPLYDAGVIAVSYDPFIVSSRKPECHSSFCPRNVKPIPNP